MSDSWGAERIQGWWGGQGQRGGGEEGRADVQLALLAGWGLQVTEGPPGPPPTHSSDTVYLSASGSQATLPIHTP